MGLSVYLKNNENDVESLSMSHGGIHLIRAEAIRATIRYLESLMKGTKKAKTSDENDVEEQKSEFLDEELEEIIQELKEWVKEPVSREKTFADLNSVNLNSANGFQSFLDMVQQTLAVQYQNIPKYSQLKDLYFDLNLAGLHKIVVFSDCEGTYSVGDCYDVQQTLNLISDFVKKDEEDECTQELFNDFHKLINAAVETKDTVGFSG